MESTFRKIIRYFFSGTLFIVPLTATAYFIYVSFSWLDSLLNLPYPGLGVLIILVAITAFGYLTSNLAFQTLSMWFDHGMNRIPLVKLIYSSLKDLLNAFVGDKKKFNKPVLEIGFVTQSDLSGIGINDMISVYIPHSYALSGMHYIVPKENVKPLNISGPVAMKYIVSGGVSGFTEQH